MTKQQRPATRTRPERKPEVPALDTVAHSAFAQRIAGPQTHDEAEGQYIAARDAWTAAMRAANSGRPADMAALAIAQEAYEAAAAERDRWMSGSRVAITIEPEDHMGGIETAVEQELRWRKVRHPHEEQSLLTRVRRRLFGG
jgi:hypothetical protein